ncbi:MAG TPA: Ig-like domain-containing protein, partial [Tepidisphaeraceae bacterium]
MRQPLRYKVLPVVLVLMGLGWVWANFRGGRFVADPRGVSMVTLTRPGNGEKDVLPNTFVSADLNSGQAVDPQSLSGRAVVLYRTKDHQNVAAALNMSAAGDAIVLQPSAPLEPGTEYTFEVTNKLKDR